MKTNRSLPPLYNFLNNYDPEHHNYYDLLRYIFDKKIYYYGNNFKNPEEKTITKISSFKLAVKDVVIDFFIWLNLLRKKPSNKIKIWNSSYFNISNSINDSKFLVGRMPWNYSLKAFNLYDFKLYKKVKKINNKLTYGNFNELISEEFFKEIDDLKAAIKEYVIKENIRAVFLANDIGFFEKLTIQIFKELKRPTFLFIHGLPGIYGKIDNNRTDFLVVWGEAIKQNYIHAGVTPDKILISGHPKYRIDNKVSLKFSFENILVLPKSMNGCPSGDEYTLRERGNCIYYMNMVQKVLQKIGVTKARFRPHPSEDRNWYLKFIDSNFFIPDTDELAVSLSKSSLVIGPTSTVFLESLISGVNYVVFEPRQENGNCLDNFPVIPPFDGKNVKVPSAQTMEELFDILNNRNLVDSSVLTDYINPNFDSNLFLEKII
ncbi:hypothetical protein [Chryseobacterium sp.]|uniref:hypothetical protein n=1 Tax=Chryseobacterium sp. TaxID=1871047 RepID=UPI0011CA444F|nr:hypothetical protein [Chryseobacterium sp.]TXF77524.1 hypothetical protein FUA25_06245 [Chryseobacterium sp.]